MGDPDSENIKVFLRVRPESKRELDTSAKSCLSIDSEQNCVVLQDPIRRFTFDHVAHEHTTQEDVFQAVGKVISDNCLQGYNGTIFAYGQTGSGKTHTMQGPQNVALGSSHELRGIIPRTFEYLFRMIAREQKRSAEKIRYLCKCSFIEIYNETVFDLLDTSSPACTLHEDIHKGVYILGASEEFIDCPQKAYTILEKGAANRHVAETSMNRESSRSHSVFTIYIQSKTEDGDLTHVRESRFNLVDLAGSERQKTTDAVGMRLKEAGNINKSLSTLGSVINALVDISNGKTRHVHYRDSKLTYLLKDSLGGNAKTFIVAHVSPSSLCFSETLSTLQFAQRAKMIRNNAVINEDSLGNVEQLKEQIRKLKQENASLKVTIENQTLSDSAGECDTPRKRPRNTDFQPSQDPVNQDPAFSQLLARTMEKQKKLEEEKKELKDKLRRIEELCSKKDQYIQSEKLIIKFKDNLIEKLRMQLDSTHPSFAVSDEEKKLLMNENAQLRHTLEHHPEVMRYAYENLQLREKLHKHEQTYQDIKVYEQQMQTLEAYEARVVEQVVQLGEENDALRKQVSTLTSSSSLHAQSQRENTEALQTAQAKIKELEGLVSQALHWRTDLATLTREKELLLQQVASAREAQDLLEVEIESKRRAFDDMASSLDALRRRKDMDAKRFQDLLDVAQWERQYHHQQLRLSALPSAASSSTAEETAELSDTDGSQQLLVFEKILRDMQKESADLTTRCTQLEETLRATQQTAASSEQQAKRLSTVNAELTDALETHQQRLSVLLLENETLSSAQQARYKEVADAEAALRRVEYALQQEREAHVRSCTTFVDVQASMDKDMAVTEDDLRQAQSHVEQLTSSLEDAQGECESLQNELVFFKAQFDDLQAESAVTKESLQQAEKALQTLRTEYRQLETLLAEHHVAELQTTVQSLTATQAELELLRADKDTLQQTLARTTEQQSATQQEVSVLKGELVMARSSQQSTADELKHAQQEWREISDRYEEVRQALTALETRFDEAQQAFSVTEKQLKVEAREAAAQATASLHSMQQQHAQREAECETLSATVADYQQQLAIQQEEMARLQTELNETQQTLAQVRQHSEEALAELRSSHQAYTAPLEAFHVQMDVKCRELLEEQQKLYQWIDDAQKVNDDKARHIEQLSEEVRALKERDKRLVDVESLLSQATAQLTSVAMERDMLRHQTAQLQGSLDTAQQNRETLMRERDQLQAAERAHAQQIDELSGYVEKWMATRQAMQTQLAQVQAMEAQAHEECELQKTRVSQLQEDVHRWQAECDALHHQLRAQEQDNAALMQHSNAKQKLQYHVKIKKESNELREEVMRLRELLLKSGHALPPSRTVSTHPYGGYPSQQLPPHASYYENEEEARQEGFQETEDDSRRHVPY